MLEMLFSPVGRVGRGRFWLFTFVLTIVSVVLIISAGAAFTQRNEPRLILCLALMLTLAWCHFCISVKRLHDSGKPAAFYVVLLIPVLGALWFLYETGFSQGMPGANMYGPPPGSKPAGGPAEDEADKRLSKALEAALANPGAAPVRQAAPPRSNFPTTAAPTPAPRVAGRPSFGRRGL